MRKFGRLSQAGVIAAAIVVAAMRLRGGPLTTDSQP
jgi:hypothetical protein